MFAFFCFFFFNFLGPLLSWQNLEQKGKKQCPTLCQQNISMGFGVITQSSWSPSSYSLDYRRNRGSYMLTFNDSLLPLNALSNFLKTWSPHFTFRKPIVCTIWKRRLSELTTPETNESKAMPASSGLRDMERPSYHYSQNSDVTESTITRAMTTTAATKCHLALYKVCSLMPSWNSTRWVPVGSAGNPIDESTIKLGNGAAIRQKREAKLRRSSSISSVRS